MDNIKYVKLDIDRLLEITRKKHKTIKKTTLNFLLKNLKGGANQQINSERGSIIISKSDDPDIIETLYFIVFLGF